MPGFCFEVNECMQCMMRWADDEWMLTFPWCSPAQSRATSSHTVFTSGLETFWSLKWGLTSLMHCCKRTTLASWLYLRNKSNKCQKRKKFQSSHFVVVVAVEWPILHVPESNQGRNESIYVKYGFLQGLARKNTNRWQKFSFWIWMQMSSTNYWQRFITLIPAA